MGQKKNENYCVNDTCEGESEYDSFGKNESEEETDSATRKKEEERGTAIKEWASREPMSEDMKSLSKIKVMIDAYHPDDERGEVYFGYADLILDIEDIVDKFPSSEKFNFFRELYKRRYEKIGRRVVLSGGSEEDTKEDTSLIEEIRGYLTSLKIPSSYLLIAKLELEAEENNGSIY
jgi:hypothetical protein